MTKKSFQFQLILKQFLIYSYIVRELKQSTYNLLKALSFLEIFLLLLSVMVVELNLLNFKQNRSVNGYVLNCFPLIHCNNCLKVAQEHYNYIGLGGGKGLRHSGEVCSSPARVNTGSSDNQKIISSCYAYSKMPEITLVGTHMCRILLCPGKVGLPGGWYHPTINLPGFDTCPALGTSQHCQWCLTSPRESGWQSETSNAAPWMLDFVCFCFFFFVLGTSEKSATWLVKSQIQLCELMLWVW